jgi:hypothetical protein
MAFPECLDLDEVMAAAEDEMFGTGNMGFCIVCGAEHYSCEPDACNYECEECGRSEVFGAAEILAMFI